MEQTEEVKRKEYIERNALIHDLKDWLCIYPACVKRAIQNQPEFDVVEVVRCNQCKHRKTNECPMFFEGVVKFDDGHVESDIIIRDNTCDSGFCDRAERET